MKPSTKHGNVSKNFFVNVLIMVSRNYINSSSVMLYFYNSLNTNDQDALDSAAGGNFLDKMPRDGLAIIESKSKVRYSRSRAIEPRASTNAPLSTSTPSNSFEFQQLAASLEDKMDNFVEMSRLEKMISEKNVTTPATVKAVEEVCVTCGSNHNFNNCPLTRNEFPAFHDNIHQFQQTAAVGNFVQRNPPNLANQMRPPSFNQSNVQNNQGNQSRYQGNNFNSNQNRGGNFNQNHQNNQGQVFQPPTNQPPVYQVPPYQAPTPQIQGVSKMDFENYVKANDAVLKNVQNQGQNLQNQMANVTSLLTNLCNNFKDSASTSNSGTLPSQTVTNPRQQINAITTRSGKTLEGPSTPLFSTPVVSNPQKEPKLNPETSTEKVQNPNLENTAHVPPPEEEDSIFMEIPKPKAKKTVNVEIQDLNSPRPNSYQPKLPYPERMKVRENDKPSAQHSRFLKMFKQLRLEIGLKDALVEMPKFNKWLSSLLRNKEKLEEIAITTVNAECSAIIMNKVPEKLEDPRKFLIPCALQELDRTSALADSGASINLLPHSIYKKLGLEALTPTRMTLELANRSITHPMGIAEDVEGIAMSGFQDHSNPLFEFDDIFKSSTILASFCMKLEEGEICSAAFGASFGLNTLIKVACFVSRMKIMMRSSRFSFFIAMEVSSNFEEGYFDSEGDLTFLDNLLSDDASYNLASKVISDHEQEQNESSITFSPRSDPLHHEFADELLTLPSRNALEFGEYLSLMTVLCEISTSQSQENVHANQSSVIESLLPYLYPVEDSEPAQVEIDIFLVPDDLIPPGVENDASEDEDNELPNLDHQDDPSIPRPPPEPPDIEKCFEPEGGILIIKVFKDVSKPHDFMTNILPTLPTLVSDLTFILFLSSFLSFGSEDTVFDPGIITFPFSYLDPVAFSMEVSCVALPKEQTKAGIEWCLGSD
ncbi:reverse transcriptase domain-containing protein [Tanacetum coccineum]